MIADVSKRLQEIQAEAKQNPALARLVSGSSVHERSELLSKISQAIQGRGQQLAAELGLRRKGKSYFCPHPENHAHGERHPSLVVDNGTGRFKCFGASCGINGSLVRLAQELGSTDPWGAVVQVCGLTLTPVEQHHLEKLRRKGVRW
jgi:DNA primase